MVSNRVPGIKGTLVVLHTGIYLLCRSWAEWYEKSSKTNGETCLITKEIRAVFNSDNNVITFEIRKGKKVSRETKQKRKSCIAEQWEKCKRETERILLYPFDEKPVFLDFGIILFIFNWQSEKNPF